MASTAYPELVAAVQDALRAPSVHNTQPWLWGIAPRRIELYADWTRHLAATDPDRRDLVISCGAALHHLRVALTARGLAADVTRFPDPEDSGHLATFEIRPGPVDTALHPAIATRRSDRRRFGDRPLAAADRDVLARLDHGKDVLVLPVLGDARDRLADVLAGAARRQAHAPGYAAELRAWTRRYAGGRDGLAWANVLAASPEPQGEVLLRRFPHGGLRQPPPHPGRVPTVDAAEALVIVTTGDDPIDALRAGETASAVLLGATALGLATTPLSQGLEVESSRHELQYDVLGVPEHPQLVIRLGRPVAGVAALPPSPRRRLDSVLLPT